MIKSKNNNQLELDFYLHFSGKLNPNTRWVKLAQIVSWVTIQKVYESGLNSDQGTPTIPARVAIGALIIKYIDNLTDENTKEMIKETPYYQYFLGYHSFTDKQVFAPSLFVTIRLRFDQENIQKTTETLIREEKIGNKKGSRQTKSNRG